MKRFFIAAVSATLFLWGCAAPPTMTDVEEVTADTSIVFGSVEVYEAGKLKEWGTRFFGYDHFYLTILPANSNEAITYKLDKTGNFFWSLPPGEYTLLGFVWDSDTGQRSGRIGVDFSVEESGADAYLGTIVYRGNVVFMVPGIEDRFGQIAAAYDAKFPGRRGSAVRRLLEAPAAVGHAAAYRGPCDSVWKVECDKRFRGVTPISPEVTQSGFPTANDLLPEFRWKGCPRSEVTYDLILYEAAAYAVGGALVPSYMKGRVVTYVEDLAQPFWRPDKPLKPDTRYFWSVRFRDGDTVSGWSTQSHSTFLLVYMSWGSGQWFQFKTS